jgi:hypothetical protein
MSPTFRRPTGSAEDSLSILPWTVQPDSPTTSRAAHRGAQDTAVLDHPSQTFPEPAVPTRGPVRYDPDATQPLPFPLLDEDTPMALPTQQTSLVPATEITSGSTSGDVDELYSADLDDDFDMHQNWGGRKVSRLTSILAVGIIAAAGFAGGVALQKNHDVGLTTASTTTGAGRASAFAGAGGGFGGGAGGGAGGSGTTAGGTTNGTGAAAATPAVVGTIASVSGSTITVKNFAGTTVTVHIPATASVTTPGLTPLTAGMTASVVGAKAADGSITATAVTAHRAA